MKQVDVEQLARVLDRDGDPPLVVDVRSGWEFASGHVPGAVHVPLGALHARREELVGRGPVYVICQSGRRSAMAVAALEDAGVEAIQVTGGTAAWAAGGRALRRTRSPGALVLPLALCLTLGLAPFVPEPHLVGKIRWVMGGGHGMSFMDVFDLALHGAPFVWLAWAAYRTFTAPRDAA